MTDIITASIAVIVVVIAIRSSYGLGHSAGMVEVKFPLHEALEPYGLYLSHANETIRPMNREEREAIGLTCPEHLDSEFQSLRHKLNKEGLDVFLAKGRSDVERVPENG